MYTREATNLALPVQVVRSAMYQAEWKAAFARRPDGRFILQRAAKLKKAVLANLLRQQAYILDKLPTLAIFREKTFVRTAKSFEDDLRRLFDEMPEQESLVNNIVAASSLSLLKGGRASVAKHKLARFGVSWDLGHKRAEDYLGQLRTLHLSDKHGSINQTTKERLIDILKDGVSSGDSYTDIAQRIQQASDAGVFSAARAEMISTNEIAKAYEYGSREAMVEAERATGDNVFKKWGTVGDDKVTEECQHNENQGWISIHEQFSSGHDAPPRFPRCRCSTLYEFESTLRLTGAIGKSSPISRAVFPEGVTES